MPSYGAEYVLHMAYSAPFSVCTQLPCFQSYGWVIDDCGSISIDWDDEKVVSFLTGKDNGCSCRKSNCTTCKCTQNNRACTIRCKCKQNCKNPYDDRTTLLSSTNSHYQYEGSESESDLSDVEQVIVEEEIQYDIDEYVNDMEI